MGNTTLFDLHSRIEGPFEHPEWELVSASQQQGQPDTWLLVVKDHRTKEDRAVFKDQLEAGTQDKANGGEK